MTSNPNPIPNDYIVVFKDGVVVRDEAQRLAVKHHFVLLEVYWLIPAFHATIEPRTVAAIRCESSVEAVEFTGAGGSLP